MPRKRWRNSAQKWGREERCLLLHLHLVFEFAECTSQCALASISDSDTIMKRCASVQQLSRYYKVSFRLLWPLFRSGQPFECDVMPAAHNFRYHTFASRDERVRAEREKELRDCFYFGISIHTERSALSQTRVMEKVSRNDQVRECE